VTLRRLAPRVLLVIVLVVAASEAALQVAGVVARGAVGRGVAAPTSSNEITILCVGDSHTYGLPLPAEQSYPAQLEEALRRRHPGLRFRVANLGIPGLNSAFVANRLERQMLQLRPHMVIVWVGVNNRWNIVETEAWREEARESRWGAIRQALMVSRLFRLASIAWFTRTGHQYDPDQRGGWFEGELPPSGKLADGSPKEWSDPGLAFDLERMVETARALSTPILFVSYPLHPDNSLNRTIRETGQRLRVPVLVTSLDRDRATQSGHGVEELIDTRQGPHPTALLYRYVVESMVPIVEEALASWHQLELENAGS